MQTPYNKRFLNWAHTIMPSLPNDISIGSAVFAVLIRVPSTDEHCTCGVCISGAAHLYAMRPKNWTQISRVDVFVPIFEAGS